jgi:hypothetical protein
VPWERDAGGFAGARLTDAADTGLLNPNSLPASHA